MAFEDDVRDAGYELFGDVRSGGTSDVHRARCVDTGDVVALKVYRTAGGDRRADREVEIGRSVDDSRLSLPFASGRLADGRAYSVSRWVDGLALRELIDTQGKVARDLALSIVTDIAGALTSLHESGAVHRDLTPNNVIVGDSQAVVIDVGHGRGADAVDITATGDLTGTPRYLAPELIRGEPPTPAADQYALALVTHELLTGLWPFPDGSSAATSLHHQLHTEPEPLDEVDPTIPTHVATAVQIALAKDPADRFRSVGEFERAVSGGSVVLGRHRRRGRTAAAGAAIGAIAFGVVGVVVAGGGDVGEPASAVATPPSEDAVPVTGDAVEATSSTGLPATASPAATIPSEIPSLLGAGVAAELDCNLLAETGFESGALGFNYFDNDVDSEADGRERVLASGGVDGSAVLVVGDPGAYGRYAEIVAVLPGQRYEFSASVLAVDPLDDAWIGIGWLDDDFALLDTIGGQTSVVGIEPGRVTVVSNAAPPDARFAVPEVFKDGSPGLLLADELVFAEADSGCAETG